MNFNSVLFFQLPFEEKIFTVDEKSGKTAVQFVSFDQNSELNFNGNIVEISREYLQKNSIFSDQLPENQHKFNSENETQYLEKLEKVISFIKENDLPKLVISRIKKEDYRENNSSGKLNLTQTFLNLCDAYPNAFAYFFIKDGICWMGAFSELLGKFDKENSAFKTMALAGTLPVDEEWTTKEKEEQKPVADFIISVLNRYGNDVIVSETYNHISGNIKHLRTDFITKINESDLENVISELHPTPAVCGVPTKYCQKAILDFEKHDRSFYSGYIRINLENSTRFFVNLRCAQFTKDSVLMYVGGGITAESSATKEWRETELKSQAISRNLAY